MGAEAGTVLGGKYRLEALIGRGGMGSVWRAEHLGLNAPVAVKLLDVRDAVPSGEALSRFHREARAAASIRSPHVVQILDHGVDEVTSTPFIVMELMEGESLASRLQRLGRLSPAEVTHVFNHVARALMRAHESGIIHRDLKPDNVFLVRNEDEVVAKVLDFGIAKATSASLSSGSATRTGSIMGTAYYMSPDQIVGAKSIDFHTDLWAFGVMACECLTGSRPFDADTVGALTLQICVQPIPAPSSLGPVPPGFDAWFARTVTREPARRFASAREAADALRLVLTGDVSAVNALAPSLTPTLADSSGHFRASSLTTGAPFSGAARSAGGDRRGSSSKVPWLVGGVAVVGAIASAVWRAAPTSPPSAHSMSAAMTPSAPATSAGSEFAPTANAAPATPAPSTAALAPVGELAPNATGGPGSVRPVPSTAAPIRAAPQPRRAAPRAAAPKDAAPKDVVPKAAPQRDVIDERH